MSKAKPTALKAVLASNGHAPKKISPDHLKVHALNVERMKKIGALDAESAALKAAVGAHMADMAVLYGLSQNDGIEEDGTIVRANGTPAGE